MTASVRRQKGGPEPARPPSKSAYVSNPIKFIKYGDVTIKSIPQGTSIHVLSFILHFLWVRVLSSNAIHSKCVRYIVTIVLLDPQYMIGVRNLLRLCRFFSTTLSGVEPQS